MSVMKNICITGNPSDKDLFWMLSRHSRSKIVPSGVVGSKILAG